MRVTVLAMWRSWNRSRPEEPLRSTAGRLSCSTPAMVMRGSLGCSTITTASMSGMLRQVSSPKHLEVGTQVRGHGRMGFFVAQGPTVFRSFRQSFLEDCIPTPYPALLKDPLPPPPQGIEHTERFQYRESINWEPSVSLTAFAVAESLACSFCCQGLVSLARGP